MKKIKYLHIVAAVAAVMATLSCVKESQVSERPGPDDKAVLSVGVSLSGPDPTRSILSDETLDSGFQLLAYRHATGALEGVYEFSGREGGKVRLQLGETYDFRVIGNLWFIDCVTGGKKSYKDYWEYLDWSDADCPMTLSGLTDTARMPYYRFDGLEVADGLRTENFAEIASYGIPYVASLDAVEISSLTGNLSFEGTRLFSKVSVTVDHGGLVSPSMNEEVFRNGRLHIRQACGKVHPFLTGTGAEDDSDILLESDYDAVMDNGGRMVFNFFVPENVQDCVLPASSALRTPEVIPEGKRGLLTYVEFEGLVDGADVTAGGYGGTMLYRFYLGSDDGDGSFVASLLRHCSYNVVLTFKAGSLFNPDWRVECADEGGLADTRLLCFARDREGTEILPDRQMLAVRPGREGRACIYFNRSGAIGDNELETFASRDSTAAITDVSRSAYDLDWDCSLAGAYGLSISESAGTLTVSASDSTRFLANLGKTLPVTLSLYPGGTRRVIDVKLCENQSAGLDISGFYVGMKRTLRPAGFTGSKVKVEVLAGGRGLLNVSNAGSNGSCLTGEGVELSSGSLPLYAYRDGTVVLRLSSDDKFNDDDLSIAVDVMKPVPIYDVAERSIVRPDGSTIEYKVVDLPLDGTLTLLPAHYETVFGERIGLNPPGCDDEFSFDSAVYDQLLTFQFDTEFFNKVNGWIDCDDEGRYFIKKLYDEEKRLFGIYPHSLLDDMGDKDGKSWTLTFASAAKVRPKSTELYPDASSWCEAYGSVSPPVVRGSIGDIETDALNEARWPVLESGTVSLDVKGCSANSFRLDYNIDEGDDGYVGKLDPFEMAGIRYRWSLTGVENGENSLYFPWGRRTLSMTCGNRHSGEEYPVMNDSFTIRHKTVNVKILDIYPTDRSGSAFSLFVPEFIRFYYTQAYPSETSNVKKVFNCFGLDSFNYNQTTDTGNYKTHFTCRCFASMEAGIVSAAKGWHWNIWNDDLIRYNEENRVVTPSQVTFKDGNTIMGKACYPLQSMYDYIPFSISDTLLEPLKYDMVELY